MPLSDKLSEDDGWKREILQDGEIQSDKIHFDFKGKFLCGEKITKAWKHDNVRADQCQTCFERVRNLYNSDNPEDAYKDL